MDEGEVQLEDELSSSEEVDFGDSSDSDSEEEGETAKAIVVHNKGKGSVSDFIVLVFWCHYVLSFLVFLIIYLFLRNTLTGEMPAPPNPTAGLSSPKTSPLNRVVGLNNSSERKQPSKAMLPPPPTRMFMQHLHHGPPRIVATQTIGGLVS